MSEHTKYRVVFDDPDALDEPTKVLVPSQQWLDEAMAGGLPPIWVYWQLQDDEQQAIKEGRHSTFNMIQINMHCNGLRLALGLLRKRKLWNICV